MRFLIIFYSLLIFISSKAQNNEAFLKDVASFRIKYINDFIVEPNSPLDSSETKYLDFFEPNELFKVEAKFTLTKNPKEFDMPTYAGTTKKFIEYGKLSFSLENQNFQLPVYTNLALNSKPEFKNHLFLPFTDWTNNETTYGGGRYIDLQKQDIEDGILILDFNKAYNPYCAFKDGYRCPVPPKANHLEVEINAGERKFKKNSDH